MALRKENQQTETSPRITRIDAKKKSRKLAKIRGQRKKFADKRKNLVNLRTKEKNSRKLAKIRGQRKKFADKRKNLVNSRTKIKSTWN